MRLGDVGNPDAAANGKPLDGVRILAAEQMQALPFATQLLARLGAEVVRVEHPVHGDSGRGALPAVDDPEGRRLGATFLRNNLNKRSVGIDLKHPKGRELFIELAGHFDGPTGFALGLLHCYEGRLEYAARVHLREQWPAVRDLAKRTHLG